MSRPGPFRCRVDAGTSGSALNAAAAEAGREDLVLVREGVEPSEESLEQMQAVAAADALVGTVSALSAARPERVERWAGSPPTLPAAEGPCILVRRAAIDLAGPFDGKAPWDVALTELCRRCTEYGAIHVLAPDAVVTTPDAGTASYERADPATRLRNRALDPPRRPSVTIDVRALGGTYLAGTQVYALELARAVAGTGAVDLRLLTPPDLSASALELAQGTRTVSYEEVAAGGAEPTDLVHRPQQVYTPDDLRLLQLAGRRIVVTHQDSILYRNPSYFAAAAEWHAYRRTTRLALATADAVVFFSEHARNDALRDELVASDRAWVVPPGVDHDKLSPRVGEPPEGVDPEAIGDALLFLGTNLRHKNRPFAMRLAAALRDRYGWDGSLILAGPRAGIGSSQIEEQALLDGDSDLAARISDLGPVADAGRAWLLRHVGAVVYPSVVEGFGLVPFEAALMGTPCLFAPQGALGELPHDAALLVPWDAAASADRVIGVLRDPAPRRAHVEAIAKRASALRWEGIGRALVEVYERALASPPPAAAVMSQEALERENALRHAQSEVTRLTLELEGLMDQLGPHTLGLAGKTGALPVDVQESLLAVAARPAGRAALFRVLRTSRRFARGRGTARDAGS